MNMNGLLLTLLELVSCCTPADLGCLGDGWVVQVWWLTFFCVHLETNKKCSFFLNFRTFSEMFNFNQKN